jgi:phosphoribosyl 1,2-cyclic phosphodiesterase
MRSVRLCVLSSGSGGNCLLVEAGQTRLLVDAGLSLKHTARRCAQAGASVRDLTDVLLTHEHADHSHAAGILARKLSVQVHATAGTLRALRDPPPVELLAPLRAGEPFELGELRVHPVAVPHDACEPVAYVFEELRTGARAAIVTDLGCAPASLAAALGGLDALILEMNHDVQLLLDGPYPFSLKRRIRSDVGHLSNAQGAQLLARVLHPGLRHVVLAHLSEHNNTERHARLAAEAVLTREGSDAVLAVGSQSGPLQAIEVRAAPLLRPRQLALFG